METTKFFFSGSQSSPRYFRCSSNKALDAMLAMLGIFGDESGSFATGMEGEVINKIDMFWLEKNRHGVGLFFCPDEPLKDMPEPGFVYALVKSQDNMERVDWETVEGGKIQRYLFMPPTEAEKILLKLFNKGIKAISDFEWEEVK